MTLNGEMALILHYFTDFVYDVVVKQLLGLPWFHNLAYFWQFMTILIPSAQLLCDYLGKTNSDIVIRFDGRRCIDYYWRLVIVEINNLVSNSVLWA